MKRSLMPVFVAVVIAVGVVLALAMGGPRDTYDRTAEGQIAYIIDSFDLTECDDLSVLGSMFVRRDGVYQHVTGYAAGPECLASLRTNALGRGFNTAGEGRFEQAGPGAEGQVILFYQAPGDPFGTIEWERRGDASAAPDY